MPPRDLQQLLCSLLKNPEIRICPEYSRLHAGLPRDGGLDQYLHLARDIRVANDHP